jgi:AAA domain
MTEAPEGKVVEIGPRFRLVPFDRITIGSEPVYLVKGIIPRTGLVVAWGPPKCGKSFWTFDLVMHIALGWEYRGRRVRRGPVVYLALEGGKGFEARIEAFRQRFLPEDPDPVPFFLIADAISLVRDQADLIGCIRLQAAGSLPAVVVIDTLNRSLAGSESDDKDMAAYIRAADAIRAAFDCAVIVVHHCGIDATRPRGHTSLTGAVDAQLAIKRDASDNVVMTVEWMKDGPEGEMIASRLEANEVGLDIDGDPITSCVVLPVETIEIRKAAPIRLTAQERRLFDILEKAVTEAGATVNGTASIPRGMFAITREMAKNYCKTEGWWDGDKDHSSRTLFNRQLNSLAGKRVIGLTAEHLWITPRRNGG